MSMTTFPAPVRFSVKVSPTCLISNGCLVGQSYGAQYGRGFLSSVHVSFGVKPSVFSANAVSLQRYSGFRRIQGRERYNCLKKNSLFLTQDLSFQKNRVAAVLGGGQEASSSSSSAELSLSLSDSEQKNEGSLEPSPKTTPKPIQNRPFRLPKLLRLRPRLWLLSRKLRPYSIKKVFKRLVEVFWAHKWMSLLSLSLIFSFIFSALSTRWPSPPPALLVPYSEFVQHVVKKMVGEVSFQEGSSLLYYNVKKAASEEASKISGGLIQDLTSGNVLGTGMDTINSLKLEPPWQFVTRRVKRDETFLLTLLLEAGVKFSSVPVPWSSSAKSLVATMLMLWVPIAPFLMLMLRQINGRDSSAKRESSKPKMTRFTDVAGVDSAKAELTEIVSCLKGDTRYNGLGAQLPSGVLLHGPPGTGKTLLARAVAGEAGVAFFATSASEFVEMFVGRGAARVRELFANARKKAPCIVFIDELDAVGGRRGASFSDERDQTLNQLLTEMDGFDSDSRVLVLAATNRIDSLDPAILRPGRISRRVKVGLPDIKGREDILGIHLRGKPLEGEPQQMISTVAALTEGLAGADLANIANEAALLAGRRGATTVTLEDLLEAVDRTRFGVGESEGPVKGWRRYLAKLVADSNGNREPGNKRKLWQWKKLPENKSSPSLG